MHVIVSLRDLLFAQMADLYNAELQRLNALPLFYDCATLQELKEIIHLHTEQAGLQIQRLDTIFNCLHMSATVDINCVVQHMISQALYRLDHCADAMVRDATLITSVQMINHYHVAGYGASCTFANTLNAPEVAALLHESLDEEKEIDRLLSALARQKVNILAHYTPTPVSMPEAMLAVSCMAY